MRGDIEKLAESKSDLLSPNCCSQATMQKVLKKKRWMSKRGAKQHLLGSQLTEKVQQKDWQTSRELRETFLLLSGPSCPFLPQLEIATAWHFAPVGSCCYKPAVKCNAFCHGCALWLLLLFSCRGIRAGTQGSNVHPKESRFHIPEWNAFWHCSARPWFE